MLLTQAHKLPWALSQILPIIVHILSNLGFHKNTHHITTKIGPQNYFIPTQSLTSFGLWAKPKESPKFQKSHYDVANSKAHYDAALFAKPIATRQYFTKSQNHFYKAQISIWHLFSQNPNSNLALLYKAQIFFWQLYLHSFIKPKY